MKRPAFHAHTTHTRDAGLLRLKRVNRWLIAGSVALTAVLADVAASAFPGKTKTTSSKTTGSAHHSKKSEPTGVLAPPGQAPEHAAEGSSGEGESDAPSQEGSEGSGSTAGEPSSGESGGETQAPETSPEASSEAQSAPESQSSESSGESSEPVVSGAS